ncbi:MAG: hypothetical protein ABEJ36_01090 [Candidatus Nanosalina sp.]
MTVNLWMVFEAVAPEREGLEDSLEDHLEKLESEKGVEIVESEIDEVSKVEDPHPGLDEGFSQVCEVRTDIDDFSKAVELVINYGPTYVQLEGPDNYEITLREGQETLQNVANTMHQYAQMGAGGVLISRPSEDN